MNSHCIGAMHDFLFYEDLNVLIGNFWIQVGLSRNLYKHVQYTKDHYLWLEFTCNCFLREYELDMVMTLSNLHASRYFYYKQIPCKDYMSSLLNSQALSVIFLLT